MLRSFLFDNKHAHKTHRRGQRQKRTKQYYYLFGQFGDYVYFCKIFIGTAKLFFRCFSNQE